MAIREFETANESETEALGRRFAVVLPSLHLIAIRGPLGTGKTTFVRGLLRGLGHEGAVKSPTFTLIEPYSIGGLSFCHFDLYRLNDPEELEFLAIRDYLGSNNLCVVEWPERAGSLLPLPDLDVMIRSVNHEGRVLQFQASTPAGEAALLALR